MTRTRTTFGTAVGIALGFAVAFGNFGDMCIVGAFALVSYGISNVLASQVDLSWTGVRRVQRSN